MTKSEPQNSGAPPWDRDFFEIAIYRVTMDDFRRQYEAAWAKEKAGIDSQYGGAAPSDTLKPLEDYFWRAYGMPWRYNQAIGWVRLYSLGNQLRGELWLHEAKRYQRVIPHKHFLHQGTAFELSVDQGDDSATIAERLRNALCHVQRDLHGGRFVLDLECFDALAPVIDWRRLLWNR